MATQPEQLKARTKQYAICIVRVFKGLPKNDEGRIIGKQLLRAGTSVAANYQAVCRSRSKAEFISKMSVVVEEADETAFWLELLVETVSFPRSGFETRSPKPMNCWQSSPRPSGQRGKKGKANQSMSQ